MVSTILTLFTNNRTFPDFTALCTRSLLGRFFGSLSKRLCSNIRMLPGSPLRMNAPVVSESAMKLNLGVRALSLRYAEFITLGMIVFLALGL